MEATADLWPLPIIMSSINELILKRLDEKVELATIKAELSALGIPAHEHDALIDAAHVAQQQQADRDPWIRLLLGPAMLIIAGMAFYTEWQSRRIGPGSIIGLTTGALGLKLVWSLIKQWRRK